MRLRVPLLLLATALVLAGCQGPGPDPSPNAPADTARPEVAIAVLDGPPGEDEVGGLERRLFPVELARALEERGGWGRVRVTPGSDSPAELLVSGRHLPSPPGTLRLRLRAEDAAGHLWLDREYLAEHPADLPGQAASDLAAARARRPAESARSLPLVRELRAAARFASPSFAAHLDRDADGRVSIARLPAENDPDWVDARRILARESLLADALDARYRALAEEAATPLAHYRTLVREEARRRLSLERRGLLQPFRILAGGLLEGFAIFSGALGELGGDPNGPLDQATDELNRTGDELSTGLERDLVASRSAVLAAGQLLHAEMAPSVVELDGRVQELTGSAEVQYARFRALLRARREQETGGQPPPE